MKFIYPAVFHPMADGTWSASFPDLEGCTAAGRDLEDAVFEAHDAAEQWLILELEELTEDAGLPCVTDIADIPLSPGDVVRNICVTVRLYEGWDE